MSQFPSYWTQYRRDKALGIARTIERALVAEHVERLHAQGISYTELSEASGLAISTVAGMKLRPGPRVNAEIGRRLLAVTPESLGKRRANPAAWVPRVGAVRRIQALQAIGHTHGVITAHMEGVGTSSGRLLRQGGRWVTHATHNAVVRAYDALSMTPGASELTRERALRRGWLPPLAWDDERIDDPTYEPPRDSVPVPVEEYLDEAAIYRRMEGDRGVRLTRPEKVEVVRRLRARGESWASIERRTGLRVDRYVVMSKGEREGEAA